jgi:hypothetical protein
MRHSGHLAHSSPLFAEAGRFPFFRAADAFAVFFSWSAMQETYSVTTDSGRQGRL